jgi:hypothetical protein
VDQGVFDAQEIGFARIVEMYLPAWQRTPACGICSFSDVPSE